MKKIFLALILFFNFSFALAVEELQEAPILLEGDFEKPVLLEPEDIEKPKSPLTLKGLVEKDYDLNSTDGFLREHLTYKYKKGILDSTSLQFRMKGNFDQSFSGDGSKYNVNQVIVGAEGYFKGKKELYNVLFDFIPHGNENYLQQMVLDAWVGTKRIPNHLLMFGSSRLNVGMEGGNSTFLLPFATRSQSARTIGNARKTGVRLQGDYKYIDYDLGGYSSDQKYHEFMPGVEGDLWVNLKPLANVKDKYGDLKLGGGIQAGERNSTDYFTASTAIRYDYKKMWFMAEYQNADGSNGGDGLVNKKRDGYNLTLAYRPTKKLEFLLRYDDFDYDKKIKDTNQKEYTAGMNYYILGQGLRLIFNYVFCQSDIVKDSHKLIFGTQIIL
ncbi:MAG: hypothetical protein IJD57_08215 [Candidatus Gastranaerophilales bacterium]|nr:hypothetical protein [Candidatus Gastranaerophilales bacterium]